MIPNVGRIVVHDDEGDLARAVAEDFVTRSTHAVRERGRFAAALTGGSSPREAYRLLGEDGFADRIPWRDVHLFWGDDRVVPPAHPRSNYGLAHRLFIGRVPIPPGNLHRVRGDMNAARAAALYEAELDDFFAGPPRFDLIHLGLGDDGHVASLFPFDRERLLERGRPAVASLLRELGEWRVSLTFPVLNAARRVEFLIPSAAKARIARLAMRGPIDPIRIPAQGVIPGDGDLVWRLTREVDHACDALTRAD